MDSHCFIVLCRVFVMSLLFVLFFGLLLDCTVCTLSAVAGVVFLNGFDVLPCSLLCFG